MILGFSESIRGDSFGIHIDEFEIYTFKITCPRGQRIKNYKVIVGPLSMYLCMKIYTTYSKLLIMGLLCSWWHCWKGLMHDDVIKWKHFTRDCFFVRGFHPSAVDSPHKGQWSRALMFSLTRAWTNTWVNNGDAGDLRRHRAHHGVIVMVCWCDKFCIQCEVQNDTTSSNYYMVILCRSQYIQLPDVFSKLWDSGVALYK